MAGVSFRVQILNSAVYARRRIQTCQETPRCPPPAPPCWTRSSAPPPPLVVLGILGMCNWLHKWYKPQGALSPGQIADVFVDLLERGYLAEGPAAPGRGDAALARIEARLARVERAVRPARRKPRARS